MEQGEAQVITRIFVYGTLKRGGANAHVWPCRPLRVVEACLQGTLYDLGPYPGLSQGEDWVLGELWVFQERDMPFTLQCLDRLEGYQQPGERDEYRREIVYPEDGSQSHHPAYTYFYQDQQCLRADRRLPMTKPWRDRWCSCWPSDHR